MEKSNVSGKPRCLKKAGKDITWIQFKAAYNWNQTSVHYQSTNVLPLNKYS